MENGKPASKLERNIEYYSEEDIKMAKELAEQKAQNKEEAMSARSLFQLAGAVKNVTITQTSAEGNTMADMDCFRTGTIKAALMKRNVRSHFLLCRAGRLSLHIQRWKIHVRCQRNHLAISCLPQI